MLTQTTLIENIAKAHGVNGTKHSLSTDSTFFEADENDPSDQKEFQKIIGGLLYIARTTRPEIMIHINLLGRRTKAPSASNLRTARDICRYLLSTKYEGLRIEGAGKVENPVVKIYADASYGGE